MTKRVLLIVLRVAVLGLGWYAFRQERLFIDEVVEEKFPQVMSRDCYSVVVP